MVQADPGSFRDPASGVLLGPNRVYRFFTSGHVADFEALVEAGLLDDDALMASVVGLRHGLLSGWGLCEFPE